MNKSIPLKTLDTFKELLKTLINDEPQIITFQFDDMVVVQFLRGIDHASAYMFEDDGKVKYINKLAFSPAQIDAIESFAEDWHNGIVYHKHYDAEESQQDKLFTEFYKRYKG